MKNRFLPNHGEKGFSLLEILVAFSILTISLTVLLNIFSSSVQSAMISEEYAHAVQIADSLMARMGEEFEIQEGAYAGEDGEKYYWELMIQSFVPVFDDESSDKETVFPVDAYRILVHVYWGEEGSSRSVDIETIKLKALTGNDQLS